MNFTPWLHIILITSIYLALALTASKVIKLFSGEIKDIKTRTSSLVLFTSAIANVLILVSAIIILIYIDNLPIGSLGLNFTNNDLLFSISSIIITIAAAVIFLNILSSSGKLQFKFHFEVESFNLVLSFLGTCVVLLIVAVQEEVVFRGYIILNLIYIGPAAALIISSIIFALIHLPTNKISLPQVTSWLLGGIILAYVYIISGSIWVVIILHFIIDLTNIVTFNIAGKFSMFEISPPLTDNYRFIFRVSQVVFIFILINIFYGSALNLIR